MLPTRTREDIHYGEAGGNMTSVVRAVWVKLLLGNVNL